MSGHAQITVIIIGGVSTLDGQCRCQRYRIDPADTGRLLFHGVLVISIEKGLSTGDLEEAHIKRALSEHAAETIVLASEEKLVAVSPYRIMPLVNASGIVLNGKGPRLLIRKMKRAGLEVYRT